MLALLIAFIAYAGALIGIGLYGYTKARTSLAKNGERTINYWITALSAHAADMSIWLFFGFPGAVYLSGAEECWTIFGLIGGMWATWRFIAPRLRTASERSNSATLTHFLCHTAGDRNGYLTLISSCLLIFFFLFYLAVGFNGIGKILSFAFGLPLWVGVVGSALLVTTYISLGGHLTVALADAFQGIFLLCMIIIVPAVTAWKLGQAGSLHTAALLNDVCATGNISAGVINALSWGLGYVGMPHILSKFMTIDSVKNMRKAQYVGLSFQTIALTASAAIGLLARAYFVTPPASSEHLFLQMVLEQCTPLLAGFILCAMMAATISTLDAQLIVCASVIAHDLMPTRWAKLQGLLMRLSTAVIAATGVWIALVHTSSLHEMVRYAWEGLGSTFGPLVIMSLYAPQRLTTISAVMGILIGGLTAALWPLCAPVLASAPLIPGFCAGLAAMYAWPLPR